MSTRSNGGIIGPQNRTTTAYANGVWHLFDAQQSVYARTWPGFVPVAPQTPGVGTVTLGSGSQAAYLTATIPFTTFYDGGNTVTKATAISIPGGLTANTNGSSPITISGLTSNTNYTFAVFVSNYYGNSPYGYSNPVKTAGVPAAPTIGTATLVGGNVNIAYTTNSNGGAPITSVTAISTPGNVTATGTSSPILITGLASGTSYTFKVYATNVMGNSDLSAASNSVTTPTPFGITYLAVGGGGGGGTNMGGGGGAGAFVSGSLQFTGGNTYTINVGLGGAANGFNGLESNISGAGITTVIASGGGYGGVQTGPTVGNGASGGGGWGGNGAVAGGTGSSGFNGGSGYGGGAGGGGGSSANGSNYVSTTQGGNGGAGSASSITGSSLNYAGGGGGGSQGTGSSGGSGGGGAGAGGSGNAGAGGTVNTGGGGGGGGNGLGSGGNGGSGVVILSIPTGSYSGNVTGAPTITTSGGNTILKYTGSGSYTA